MGWFFVMVFRLMGQVSAEQIYCFANKYYFKQFYKGNNDQMQSKRCHFIKGRRFRDPTVIVTNPYF